MNYGIRVRIKFKEDCPYKGAMEEYRNVTEIHYNYCDGKKFGAKRKKGDFYIGHKVAFESDIHRTGITQPIDYIEEFETELEEKKEKDF